MAHNTSFRFALPVLGALALGVAALASPAAHAEAYSGTFTLTDTSAANNNGLTFSQIGSGAFSWNLALNQPYQDNNLATFTTTDSSTGFIFGKTSSDEILATFNFVDPNATSKSTGGDITETATESLFGHFSSTGELVFDTDNLAVNFTDGSAVDILLGPSLFTNTNGTSDAQVVSAQITQTKTAVPEPASIALLGSGVLGLGMMMGRRRRAAV